MQYDVIVIGSGPGGYVAAIRCAQLKLKTALIEKYTTLGGTCLNVGCIPSKALLDSSEHYHNALKKFANHGIQLENLAVDWPQMMQRKQQVVKQTCDGIQFLMKKNKIDVFEGLGSFVSAEKVRVKLNDGGDKELTAKNVIIATGSKPSSLPNVTIDKERVITSTEALSLPSIPKSMTVIGGGVIGLELGSVYARLGTEVSVVEYLDSLIPTMDRSMGKELQRSLKKLGMKFHLKHAVQKAEVKDGQVVLVAKNSKDEVVEFTSEVCLVAVGRKPYTAGLETDKAGVELDNRGRVLVNEHLQTSVANIYAIGDVVRGAMLAHKAEDEGIYVAERIAGQKPHINYNTIPNVVYTWPEVAGVGATEEQLKADSRKYKAGQFSYKALGRARAADEPDGLVKVLTDAQTDEILGIHMIGARAADMIAEAVVAMEFRASAEDIGRICHAHPTFTEAVKEACLDATGKRAIHF